MKHITIFLVVIAGIMKSHAELRIIDQIAVVVDEKVITSSEVIERVQLVRSSFLADKSRDTPPENVLVGQVVERLILEHLQLQIAERALDVREHTDGARGVGDAGLAAFLLTRDGAVLELNAV